MKRQQSIIWQRRRTLNKLLDLDLAIIEEAYQTEFVAWQNRKERERLLRTERLAAIGETMAGLVHESRNILQRCRDLFGNARGRCF